MRPVGRDATEAELDAAEQWLADVLWADPVSTGWKLTRRLGSLPAGTVIASTGAEMVEFWRTCRDHPGATSPRDTIKAPPAPPPDAARRAANAELAADEWAEVSAAAKAGTIPDWLYDAIVGEVHQDAELLTRADGVQCIQLPDGTVIPNARQAYALLKRAEAAAQ